MRKIKLIICLLIMFVITYIIIGFSKIENQPNVKYINKQQVLDVLNNEIEYFNSISAFYENVDSKVIIYDLSAKKLVPDFSDITEEEFELLEALFEKYSFNYLEKNHDTLSIYFHRPFNHKINIGLVYDYKKEKWDFLYNHNYEGCTVGHWDGYRIYDLVFN